MSVFVYRYLDYYTVKIGASNKIYPQTWFLPIGNTILAFMCVIDIIIYLNPKSIVDWWTFKNKLKKQ